MKCVCMDPTFSIYSILISASPCYQHITTLTYISLDTEFVFAREYIERQHSLPSRNIQRSPAWREAKKPVSRLCPGVFPVNDTSKAFRRANGKKNAYVHELMRIYNYLSRDENDSSHTTTLLSSPSLHTAMFFFFNRHVTPQRKLQCSTLELDYINRF